MPEREPKSVTAELVPRWKIVERVIEERVLADDFDDELAPLVTEFVDRVNAEGQPPPKPEQVIARIRHVLRHAADANQKVVLLSRPQAPFFGVTTKPAETLVVKEKLR